MERRRRGTECDASGGLPPRRRPATRENARSCHGQGRAPRVQLDLGRTRWSVGSREPGQPRTAADEQPVTESNLSRRVPAQRAAVVISSPDLSVFAVAAAGVLCAFPYVVDALPEQCLRRTPGAGLLVAAVFRTKQLLRERCPATCLRRRHAGQARRRQQRLQITARLRGLGSLMVGAGRSVCSVHVKRPLVARDGGYRAMKQPWCVTS